MSRSRRISIRNALGTLLANSNLPVFLVDASRRLVAFNRGCEQLLGWKADELLGHRCDYATSAGDDAPSAVTGHLAPPPEVFEGRPACLPVHLPHREGNLLSRLVHFHPLPDADGSLRAVLGIVGELPSPAPGVAPTPAQALHAELAALRGALRKQYGIETLIARTPAMLCVLRQVELARRCPSPVLLVGERGSGKEHTARAIHYSTAARAGAFVPLDCQRLPPDELEATLDRSLDAAASDEAVLPALQPGTLFFAHADSLPRDLQQRLLNLWGDLEGPASQGPTGVRLMFASELPVQQLVAADRWREDFAHLACTLVIDIPPLRQRMEELPLLGQHFLEQTNLQADEQVGEISQEVWKRFHQYDWPGNLDELRQVIHEARCNCNGSSIEVHHLPFRFRTALDARSVGPVMAPRPRPLEPFLEHVERECIAWALEQAQFNKSKAAELLQIPRARLYRRMQALGIEPSLPATGEAAAEGGD